MSLDVSSAIYTGTRSGNLMVISYTRCGGSFGRLMRLALQATCLNTGLVMIKNPSEPDDIGDDVDGEDDSPSNEAETRAYLLARSNRDHAPILKSFVQDPDRKLPERGGPLSVFVRNGDLRGLQAFVFLNGIISSDVGNNGWSTTLPLRVIARALDATKTADPRSASTAATKILTRLEDRQLIERTRSGRARKITVTLLRPDGSGTAYTRPGRGNTDRFLKLSHAYWTDGWYEKLDLPATAMLFVALHEKPNFSLPTARMPKWYGWSADTAERGLKTLAQLGLLVVSKRYRKEPLSPTGVTQLNSYTLVVSCLALIGVFPPNYLA